MKRYLAQWLVQAGDAAPLVGPPEVAADEIAKLGAGEGAGRTADGRSLKACAS
jgi:hypothetical protein